MLAVIAAVLALAGAPANTQVSCDPSLLGGRTWYTLSPPVVHLDSIACAGLLLAGASPLTRNAIQRLNPSAKLDYLIGDGLLETIHEATHAALQSGDEGRVECLAMKLLPKLLSAYAPNPASSYAYAQEYDASLPAEYHNSAC